MIHSYPSLNNEHEPISFLILSPFFFFFTLLLSPPKRKKSILFLGSHFFFPLPKPRWQQLFLQQSLLTPSTETQVSCWLSSPRNSPRSSPSHRHHKSTPIMSAWSSRDQIMHTAIPWSIGEDINLSSQSLETVLPMILPSKNYVCPYPWFSTPPPPQTHRNAMKLRTPCQTVQMFKAYALLPKQKTKKTKLQYHMDNMDWVGLVGKTSQGCSTVQIES